jgi:PhzF family phenazine biosynthesis protein
MLISSKNKCKEMEEAMKLKVYTINSFAKVPSGGNPAGVVPEADQLSEADMQRIATIVGFSETAFVMKSNHADYRVRFFTPAEEVDLCGHATIGAFHTMAALGLLKPGSYRQETRAGILGIEVKADLSVMMCQPLPVYSEILDKHEIAASLQLETDEIPEALPVQIISTGLRDILIPVKSLEILNSLKPDMEKIKEISRKFNTAGYHVFTLESYLQSNACCRNFAPLLGINEESATGTSNGALGCYLNQYGLIDSGQAGHLVLEQGYSMKKPSEILVSLTLEGKEITGVRVGGNALDLAFIEVDTDM